MEVKGTVENVYSKTKSTRAGDKVIWYADIDDGTTVNTGFKKMWEEGEYITAQVEEKYGELQVKRGAPSKGPSKGSAPSKGMAKGGGTYATKKFPLESTDQQVSIIRQSSLNRAVETVRDMIVAGTFKPKNEEAYLEKIWELAYEYTDFGTGQREVKAAEHQAAKRAALEAVNG